jgi:hypothetical protein
VIQALEKQIAILKDTTQSSADRSVALLFVIHLIGDMHQPLHAEDNDDRGGNCVPVTYLGTAPKSNDTKGDYVLNLHGIWDTQLVEAAGQINRKSADASSEIMAFASSLFNANTATIDQAAHAQIDLVGWANASHQIARKHPYALVAPAIPANPVVQPVVECSDSNTSIDFLNKHETVDPGYVTGVQGDVKGQLTLAGARLAAVLYSSLANTAPSH